MIHVRFIRLAGLGDVIQTLWMINQFQISTNSEFVTFKKHKPIIDSLNIKLKMVYVEHEFEVAKFILKPASICISFHTNTAFNFLLKFQCKRLTAWTETQQYRKNKLLYKQGESRIAQIVHLLAFSGLSFTSAQISPLELKYKPNRKSVYDVLVFPSGGNSKQKFGARRVSDELLIGSLTAADRAVVICGAGDETGRAFAQKFNLDYLEDLSPSSFIELFGHASRTISGDTGPAHLSVALGIETEVFCGPTDGKAVFGEHKWLKIWQSSFLCSPCYLEKTAHRDILEKCKNPQCLALNKHEFHTNGIKADLPERM